VEENKLDKTITAPVTPGNVASIGIAMTPEELNRLPIEKSVTWATAVRTNAGPVTVIRHGDVVSIYANNECVARLHGVTELIFG
jgi:hypothetical protein